MTDRARKHVPALPYGQKLRTLTAEAMAFARQAWLLPRDAMPVVPHALAEGDEVVVFLHGLFASAGVLRPLRERVTRHPGLHAASLSYAPGPGVDELADRLEALLGALPSRARVHLVGHSLGGIVARYFAHRAPEGLVAQTISLASPFAGVPSAAFLGFDVARDLAPDSAVLRRVRFDAARFAHVPHLSIVAGGDTIAPTPVAQALPFGDIAVRPNVGHNALLFDEEASAMVERRILGGLAKKRAG